ncbi:MAG: hypothetical protein O2971_17400, partial [Proteobacteria bacterium]|nr:hypothetical protein [Pseudomonadota bacterium]
HRLLCCKDQCMGVGQQLPPRRTCAPPGFLLSEKCPGKQSFFCGRRWPFIVVAVTAAPHPVNIQQDDKKLVPK